MRSIGYGMVILYECISSNAFHLLSF